MVTGFDVYEPVTMMLLLESTVIFDLFSSMVPAILVAHIPVPDESYLTINESNAPLLSNCGNVENPDAFQIVTGFELYDPVTIMLLLESTDTTYPNEPTSENSYPAPAILVAH
jgi:hypothetical protein